MRISNELYFAPGITFSQLDLSGIKLPRQFEKRITDFYLQPSLLLSENKFIFASGILLVSCIDALANAQGQNNAVRNNIQRWCSNNLPSFNENFSRTFYLDFRNGLIHEARIKNGGEFSLETKSTVENYGKSLRINPRLLHGEVNNAFSNYIEELETNELSRQLLIDWVKRNFKYELNN